VPKNKVIPIAVAAGTSQARGDDGWRALSTLSEPRLSEMAENYRALGYQVQIRDVQKSQETGGCSVCLDAGEEMGRTYGTLYVRRDPGEPGVDELFK